MTEPVPLASERVIVQAPFSYAGSSKRLLRLTEPGRALRMRSIHGPWYVGIGISLLDASLVLVMFTMLVLAWIFVTAWYTFFGVLLVPYRLIRRSDRNRKRDALQHREILAAAVAAQAAANSVSPMVVRQFPQPTTVQPMNEAPNLPDGRPVPPALVAHGKTNGNEPGRVPDGDPVALRPAEGNGDSGATRSPQNGRTRVGPSVGSDSPS